jgi:hypothetical protein
MGKIYLIVELNSDPIRYKIGITKGDASKRLKALQTGASNELLLLNEYHSNNYRKIEGALHSKYRRFSTEGGKEWFELPDSDVLKFEAECQRIDKQIKLLQESGNPFL